jgi:excisionase family DNA binding protein
MPASRTTPRRPISIDQAAAHYDVSRRTIDRWIADDLLRAYKVGPALIRLDLDHVEALAKPVATAGRDCGRVAGAGVPAPRRRARPDTDRAARPRVHAAPAPVVPLRGA